MKPRWRVLIIDDHAPSRTAVTDAVGALGGQVVGSGSRAADVVSLVGTHRPDLVILAVGLSDGDGIEAARQVMAASPCALVLFTSRTDASVAARAAKAGVLGFLAKPLREEEVGPALDLALSRFRELAAIRKENGELRKKLESRKLIDRAKSVLIQRLGLTEPEAYRRLQKTAMDTRRPMVAVAEALLLTEDVSELRVAR